MESRIELQLKKVSLILFVLLGLVAAHAQESPPIPPPDLPVGTMERPPEADMSASAPAGGSTNFATNVKKLRWMKRVPGPECTPEQWAAGKWYKGPHDHNFGWYWVVNGVYYSYAKPKARVPDYASRTVIVYDDQFDTGAIKKIAPGAKQGPQPASIAPAAPAAHR